MKAAWMNGATTYSIDEQDEQSLSKETQNSLKQSMSFILTDYYIRMSHCGSDKSNTLAVAAQWRQRERGLAMVRVQH